jgi:hypothetical protein
VTYYLLITQLLLEAPEPRFLFKADMDSVNTANFGLAPHVKKVGPKNVANNI